MEDTHIYYIQVRGLVQAEDIESIRPPGLMIYPLGEKGTNLRVCTDQAGMIGFIRLLNGLGFVLLSISCN